MGGTKTFAWNDEVDKHLREIATGLGVSQSEALRRCVQSFGPVSKEMLEAQITRKKRAQQALLEQATAVQDEIKGLEKMKNSLQQTLTRTDARAEWMKEQKNWYLQTCMNRGTKPSYEDAATMLRVRYSATRRKLGIEISELAVFASDVQEIKAES